MLRSYTTTSILCCCGPATAAGNLQCLGQWPRPMGRQHIQTNTNMSAAAGAAWCSGSRTKIWCF